MKTFARIRSRLRRAFFRPSFAPDELDRKLATHITARGGFFLEAAVGDGLENSISLYFERYRGWKGLLVEGDPALAERCRANRPKCQVVTCSLGPFNSKVRTDQRGIGQESGPIAESRPLSDLIEHHRIVRLDLLVLRPGRPELETLEGLDLERHRPTFLLLELRDDSRKRVESFLNPWFIAVASLSPRDVLFRARGRTMGSPAI